MRRSSLYSDVFSPAWRQIRVNKLEHHTRHETTLRKFNSINHKLKLDHNQIRNKEIRTCFYNRTINALYRCNGELTTHRALTPPLPAPLREGPSRVTCRQSVWRSLRFLRSFVPRRNRWNSRKRRPALRMNSSVICFFHY